MMKGGSVDGSPPGDRSPRRQRKKTVTYREDCKPAATVEPPSFGLTEVKPEFRLSLEQILQSNVFYDQETLEVAAVTGTGSARQTLPPPGGYLACWNQAVPLKDGSTGTEPIENDYDPRIEYIDAEPGGEQEQEALSCRGGAGGRGHRGGHAGLERGRQGPLSFGLQVGQCQPERR